MMNSNEISQLLNSEMRLFDLQILSQFNLPYSAKSWLTTVGVPKKAQLPYGLIFSGSDQAELFITKSMPGVIIGESEGPTYIVVRTDGIVVLVDNFDEIETYMNNTLGQFIMSLCRFAELTQNKFSMQDFQKYIAEIDMAACQIDTNFWSVAIEDMLNLQL